MKTKLFTLALTLVFGSTALANDPIDAVKTKKEIKNSSITWKAYKVTGSHYGTVTLSSGFLMFDGDDLAGGEFVVDMTTLTADDLEGEYKTKLENHLKSDDFFGIDKYQTSKLVFTKVKKTGKNAYEVTADLTIKDQTHPVTFDFSVYGSKANATVKVDRTNHDIRFRSTNFFENLGDKAIYDEFDLVVDLEF